MPVTGAPEFDENKRASWFSHKAEVAKPYYYKVYLAEHDVVAEITTTERATMFRFTFPKNEKAAVKQIRLDITSFLDEKQRRIRDRKTVRPGHSASLSILKNASSSITETPSSRAFLSFEPPPSPATR